MPNCWCCRTYDIDLSLQECCYAPHALCSAVRSPIGFVRLQHSYISSIVICLYSVAMDQTAEQSHLKFAVFLVHNAPRKMLIGNKSCTCDVNSCTWMDIIFAKIHVNIRCTQTIALFINECWCISMVYFHRVFLPYQWG